MMHCMPHYTICPDWKYISLHLHTNWNFHQKYVRISMLKNLISLWIPSGDRERERERIWPQLKYYTTVYHHKFYSLSLSRINLIKNIPVNATESITNWDGERCRLTSLSGRPFDGSKENMKIVTKAINALIFVECLKQFF